MSLKVYVGQTRSKKLCARLTDLGYGEMLCPKIGGVPGDTLPPYRTPWALDNSAYRVFKAGEDWIIPDYESALAEAAKVSPPPDFVVAPDLVGGSWWSWSWSLQWAGRIRAHLPGVPVYFVVQDGMQRNPEHVEAAITGFHDSGGFDGIFVGGSGPWKLQTAPSWVAFAHQHGIPCHIGRAGTVKKAAWAMRLGADSLDSCLPLWATRKLDRFVFTLEGRQGELFSGVSQ